MCGIFAFWGTSISDQRLREAFQLIRYRGPDQNFLSNMTGNLVLGFHRLAIMDTTEAGMQPFKDLVSGDILVCNGEIYNAEDLKREYVMRFPFQSHSDCEVLLPLIAALGFGQAISKLDAEFALVYFNARENRIMAARDPLGIRPLFYGFTKIKGEIVFASELAALHNLCTDVYAFPPGHFYDGEKFHIYKSYDVENISHDLLAQDELACIHDTLTKAVVKRLRADVQVGCLLSGGLDSSLVAAIAQTCLTMPVATFAVGCNVDPIDLKYARQVAEHIGSEHHEVIFNLDEAVSVLDKVICHLGTWDITTIRAAIGMYLVCRYVRQKTAVKVLLTGEVSDELFGYKYTDYAPSASAFQEEARKRIREIQFYDVLRADRCISAHGLEARVPFGDKAFVDTVMAIDPELKLNRHGIGKYLLRQAFASTDLLPRSILLREKAAFSDAVGHSMVDVLIAHADQTVSSADLACATEEFPYATPFTKESLLYRRIFARHYPGREAIIPGYWMPNAEWEGCNVKDPSARFLGNYGQSGT
ncbi:MAG: asparagine synthase B [Oligoflexales bacterium]